MRVLHVIPSVAPAHGGPSGVLRVMTEAMTAEGVDVEVVTTDDDGRGRVVVPLAVPRREGAVTYRYFPRQVRFYRLSLPAARWMWRHVHDYDVVHVHALFSFLPVAGALAARRRGVPYVVRPLGVLNQWGRTQRRPRLKRLSLRLVDKPVLLHAAAVQWTSCLERDQARDLGLSSNGVVVPNPVPLPERATATAARTAIAEEPVVLFLSRIDPVKSVDVLLDAFAEVVRHVPEAHLIVAGDGPAGLLDGYRAQARQSGTDRNITWTGSVTAEAREALFDRATVFVLPSRSESFGVAAVEAMARGTPVVVTPGVGISPAVAEGGAGLVAACQPGPVAAAILAYLRDPEARQRAGERGRAVAEALYAPAAVARQLVALYGELVSGRRPAEQDAVGP